MTPAGVDGEVGVGSGQLSKIDSVATLDADRKVFSDDTPASEHPFAGLLAFGAFLAGWGAVSVSFLQRQLRYSASRYAVMTMAVSAGACIAAMQVTQIEWRVDRALELDRTVERDIGAIAHLSRPAHWTALGLALGPALGPALGLILGLMVGFVLQSLPESAATSLAKGAEPVGRVAGNHFWVPDAVSLGVLLPIRAVAQLTRFFDWFLVDLFITSGLPAAARAIGECCRRFLHGDWVVYAGASLLALSAWLWLLV